MPSYRLYGGLVYCSICGGAIKWVLDSEISRDLLNRLENTTCGEELFFQTVLLNSPFSENIINNNLRIMDWNVKSPPKVLREEDFHKIIDSSCLFCRKVDSKSSKMLIKITDEQILFRMNIIIGILFFYLAIKAYGNFATVFPFILVTYTFLGSFVVGTISPYSFLSVIVAFIFFTRYNRFFSYYRTFPFKSTVFLFALSMICTNFFCVSKISTYSYIGI